MSDVSIKVTIECSTTATQPWPYWSTSFYLPPQHLSDVGPFVAAKIRQLQTQSVARITDDDISATVSAVSPADDPA